MPPPRISRQHRKPLPQPRAGTTRTPPPRSGQPRSSQPRSSQPRSSQPRGSDRWLYGRHAVTAALANPERRWRRLVALAGQEEEARRLLGTAVATHRGATETTIELRDRDGLAALLPSGAVHQGLALDVEPLPEPDLDDLLRELATAAGRQVVVVLDQVGDPQNVGAVLRSAAAFGARGVVLAAHGAPPFSGALAKAASGALERLPLVRAVNLARALVRLKAAGFWVCGLDAAAEETLAALDLGPRTVLVLGSEGRGMRRLVREHCDHLARLPTSPAQPTLNVANAAAVALYELARRAIPG
ncbi:MAG: 23S rRNA (guanosine(2251)-2'-O)-methyltransferase RlmB [Stellaceae bacterium]